MVGSSVTRQNSKHHFVCHGGVATLEELTLMGSLINGQLNTMAHNRGFYTLKRLSKTVVLLHC